MSTNGNENQNFPSAYDQYNAQQTNQPMYGAGGQPYPGNQYMAANNYAGKGLGIAALVLGILAFLSGWTIIGGVFGLIGLILGIISLVQGKKTKTPKGMAITGIVLSVLGLLSAILVTVLVMVIFQGVDFFGAINACEQYQSNQQAFEQCIYDYMGINDQVPTGTTDA